MRFDFAQREPELFSEIVGYGFITEENRAKEPSLKISELNTGMDTVYWYRGMQITKLESDELGVYASWDGLGEIPVSFATKVESEGNYKVKVTIASPVDLKEVKVFLGRRKLGWIGDLSSGLPVTIEMVTNICPIIPRTYSVAQDDDTLDVTVIGRGVRLTSVEVTSWEGPTIYIAGDSTVTDQSADYPYFPGGSYCGWGQMLSAYLGSDMAVSNHSHSGLTTESFRSEGHYDIMLQRVKPGDICLFQFGHNDQKLDELKAGEGYKDRLITYIEEIKAREATPVIVTPLARNSWLGGNGGYNDLLEEYAEVAKLVARENGAYCIDLHARTKELVVKVGRDQAKKLFFPSDYTHSNDYGAYLFASYIYAGLCYLGVTAERKYYMWAAPDYNCMELPHKPEELSDVANPDEVDIYAEYARLDEPTKRYEAFEFVIKAMKFFATNVYNDMFVDVIGHETYAGAVECAYQNGMIDDSLVENSHIFPEKYITGKEFVTVLLLGYSSRKPLPAEKSSMIDAAKGLGIIGDVFDEGGNITRGQAIDLCKKLFV